MEKTAKASSSKNHTGDARGTILVVEDEPPMLYVLEKTLAKHGYAVLTAPNGEAAIEAYCRHKSEIDVVLLDVGLPRIKGTDVLHKIKSENPAVSVVVCSGFLEPELKTMLDHDVDHFIQKPYILDELVKTIQALIERREAVTAGSP